MLENWALIIATLSLSKALGQQPGVDYYVNEFDQNPGLYYEKIQEISLIRADWRIAVFLDIKRFQDSLPDVYGKLLDYKSDCKKRLGTKCTDLLRPDFLKRRIEKAEAASNEIHQAAEEVRASTSPVDQYIPKTIQKREALMSLGGTLLHYAFGVLTSSDAENFNQEVDRLDENIKQMSQLIANQTHIVKSDLHSIHTDLDILHNALYQYGHEVEELANRTENTIQEIELVHYEAAITQWTLHLEGQLEEYIESCKKVVDTIYAAREGRLHPSLLTTGQLQGVVASIEEIHNEYEFPIPIIHLRAEELAKIAKLQTGYAKGRLFISIRVPLIERHSYHIYQMHPCPIPQKSQENHLGYAYVIPKTPYLAMSVDHRTYFLVDEKYLQSCHTTLKNIICPTRYPILENTKEAECESRLLTNPEEQVFKKCDVRLQHLYEPYWTKIETSDSWLYSYAEAGKLTIICSGLPAASLALQGTGLLTLRAGCTARTGKITLPGTKIITDKYYHVYAPDLHLNITTLAPLLHQHHELHINSSSALLQLLTPTSAEWKKIDSGTALTEIEEKFKEIGTSHRQRSYHQNLIYGGLFGQIVVFGLILIICTRGRILQACPNCTIPKGNTTPPKRSKGREEHEETEPPHACSGPPTLPTAIIINAETSRHSTQNVCTP